MLLLYYYNIYLCHSVVPSLVESAEGLCSFLFFALYAVLPYCGEIQISFKIAICCNNMCSLHALLCAYFAVVF